MARPIGTYREFWPHYLREHSRPLTRHLHFLGTALAVSTAAYAVATLTWWLVLAAAGTGYLFAWIGHLLVERNRPATFTYPVWSLASDFRMFFLWLVGRLDQPAFRWNHLNAGKLI